MSSLYGVKMNSAAERPHTRFTSVDGSPRLLLAARVLFILALAPLAWLFYELKAWDGQNVEAATRFWYQSAAAVGAGTVSALLYGIHKFKSLRS